MSTPQKLDNRVYKKANRASETIHQLLIYAEKCGIKWVPRSFGIDTHGYHVLSFLPGRVPSDTPSWLWDLSILTGAAKKLRQWHDITSGFSFHQEEWLLDNDEPREIICHNDFAPYNAVFQDKQLVGIIDFDTASPGSRLWDLAYAAYRFVPLLPEPPDQYETSPFPLSETVERLGLFLKAYSGGNKCFLYSLEELVLKLQARLKALALWSVRYGNTHNRPELIKHAEMYRAHENWVLCLL